MRDNRFVLLQINADLVFGLLVARTPLCSTLSIHPSGWRAHCSQIELREVYRLIHHNQFFVEYHRSQLTRNGILLVNFAMRVTYRWDFASVYTRIIFPTDCFNYLSSVSSANIFSRTGYADLGIWDCARIHLKFQLREKVLTLN